MSLKIVHVAFIICCLALSAVVGVWGISSYRAGGAILGLILASVFLLLGVALAIYLPRYWVKMKDLEKMKRRGMHLVTFAVLTIGTLLLPDVAHACAVCYGDPDSVQVIGLNRAIWVLLAIVGAVQVGFVSMFVQFRRRARRTDVDEPSGISKGAAE